MVTKAASQEDIGVPSLGTMSCFGNLRSPEGSSTAAAGSISHGVTQECEACSSVCHVWPGMQLCVCFTWLCVWLCALASHQWQTCKPGHVGRHHDRDCMELPSVHLALRRSATLFMVTFNSFCVSCISRRVASVAESLPTPQATAPAVAMGSPRENPAPAIASLINSGVIAQPCRLALAAARTASLNCLAFLQITAGEGGGMGLAVCFAKRVQHHGPTT